ncbi:MAG: polysaccharide pyruvyl transferase CsaB [Ruminococcaceae bacterium]|nr:polysaccharide pyruvyl transferase CsaB [Oscillospiraceae bacterium]
MKYQVYIKRLTILFVHDIIFYVYFAGKELLNVSDKKIKIMHIISGGDKGGAKTHMFTLLDELCKIADVTVVCLMRGVFYEEIIERDVRTVLLEQRTRMDFSVCKSIQKMVREEKFDIINAHGARANVIAMRLNQRKLNIPIVTTVHSDPLLDFDSFVKRLVFTNLNLRALKKLNYKIAVSDSMHSLLLERGFMPNDVLTVYNGMDFITEEKVCSKEEFAKRFNIPYDPDKIYMGVAARFSHVKGVDIFLKSAAEVLKVTDKARFVIIGEGEDEQKLKALAKEYQIEDKVYFLGFIKEIYDFFNFIDVNMLTSRSEGFPYSILEGAKMKKATVAAAVGGITQLITDEESGYIFEPGDYKECAKKILQLINDPEKIKEFGDAVYHKASVEFSNKALAEAYLNNYKRFIAKHKRTKKYDIILSGYYGFGNFGDDLVLMLLIERLKKENPYLEILALTKDPHKSQRIYNVNCKNRYNFKDVLSAIKHSNNYINGGGTLLTDVTSKRSLDYYCSMLRYAKKKGLNTMLLGSGIGPFNGEQSKKKAKQALECTDIIALRDTNSLEIIKGFDLKNKIYSTADMAFLLSSDSEATRLTKNILRKNNLKKDNYFVVSLREWKYNAPDFESAVAAACDYIAKKHNIIPVFIPVQPEKDLSISRQTASIMETEAVIIDRPMESINILPEIISGSRFSLSMRLHPIICSFVYSKPVIALSYDTKVSGFVEENNAGLCIDVSEITKDKLIEFADKLENLKTETNRQKICELKAQAEENITLALNNLKLN